MANSKEIVFLIRSIGGGGSERVCLTVANALAKEGWRITLVVLGRRSDDHWEDLDGSIEKLVLGEEHARASVFKIHRFMAKSNARKVLVFNHQLAALLVLIRMFSVRRYTIIARNISVLTEKLANEKSFWHRYVVGSIVSFLYRKVDRVIAQSEGMKADLLENFGFIDGQVTVINNPVGEVFENFRRQHDVTQERERSYLLCVGRLDPVKRFHVVIEALERLRHVHPQLTLKFVGRGEMEGGLMSLSERLGVAGSVSFEGYQKDTIPFYLHARATVLTSLYEGFPNVLIESITLGTPVVSFDCPSGPREIVQSGKNGFLVENGNIDQLVSAIDRLMINAPLARDVAATAERFFGAAVISRYEAVLMCGH